MNEQTCIERVLDCAAEDQPDFQQRLYDRFYQLAPAAEALMTHIDEEVQGKMLAEVIRLFLSPDVAVTDQQYLLFETKNHAQAYFVEPEMYRALNQALFETLKVGAGRIWSSEVESAVHNRLSKMSHGILEALAVWSAKTYP